MRDAIASPDFASTTLPRKVSLRGSSAATVDAAANVQSRTKRWSSFMLRQFDEAAGTGEWEYAQSAVSARRAEIPFGNRPNLRKLISPAQTADTVHIVSIGGSTRGYHVSESTRRGHGCRTSS